jgi:hypothetical protein
MQQIFTFDELQYADLIVDAVYKGGTRGNASDDPLHKLIGCGLQGGFRFIGSSRRRSAKLVVLYTSMSDPDWPDYLDERLGQFFYFGDNKAPGHLLHDTPRRGNIILRDSFEAVHNDQRDEIPPFLVFFKGALGRDVVFKGLAVPGADGLSPTEDLVAIWKSKEGQRFQNYRAIFTILDVPSISKAWLEDIKKGNTFSKNCPTVWLEWVHQGVYSPLKAERSVDVRSQKEQVPKSEEDMAILKGVYNYFSANSYGFEKCAAELAKLMDRNVVSYDLTRPWVDGGRDAIGKYRIGMGENSIDVEFALEAKCYGLKNAVGVKETSRLISRLRHRQFGIFVTTSYVHRQAYKEIKEDRHPVIIISASDIVKILKRAGYSTESAAIRWLKANFPEGKRNES